MKKCPKCGRTSPPALAICPRCKTPFNAHAEKKSAGYQTADISQTPKTSSTHISTRIVVIASVLIVLVVAAVFFMKSNRMTSVLTEREPASQQDIVRPGNFNELLGTWSGREINGGNGWTVSFSDGYKVYASGPEGWYRGKAAIHYEIGGDKDGIRVPPGKSVLDIDIETSSVGDYIGKTSVGAFYVSGGTTLKLCNGEPGKTERPETLEPASGFRCFELTKTAEAQIPPTASQQVEQSATEAPAAQIPAGSEGDVAAAREAFKNCVAAYKAGNIEEAKKYIASTSLSEMEQSEMFDMAMGMMSGLNIDEFTPTLEGNRMVFQKSEKQRDMSMSMSITMVEEDGKWKLGK